MSSIRASRFPSDQLAQHSNSALHRTLAGIQNRRHVETNITARSCAGGPVTSAALLHGRRGPEVLLRGIAQGHAGCWYDAFPHMRLLAGRRRRLSKRPTANTHQATTTPKHGTTQPRPTKPSPTSASSLPWRRHLTTTTASSPNGAIRTDASPSALPTAVNIESA
jgi:hypothetical protein